MSYDKNHTKDDCDKCLERVGKENLTPIKFLYLDRNDLMHPDYYHNATKAQKDYKLYYVCKNCLKNY